MQEVFFDLSYAFILEAPNGVRYLLAGGTRERHFNGTGFGQRKCLKTRRVPASQVHAVLGVSS